MSGTTAPNIHLATIRDFREFCRTAGLKVLHEMALRTTSNARCTRVGFLPNLRADTAIFVVEKRHLAAAIPRPRRE